MGGILLALACAVITAIVTVRSSKPPKTTWAKPIDESKIPRGEHKSTEEWAKQYNREYHQRT